MKKKNIKELSENTEKQQVNPGKQEDSEAKKSGLYRFFEEIFYLIFLLLIAVPFLIIAVGYFLGKAIIYILIFPCFIFHAAFVAFQLFLDYIDAKKANAKSYLSTTAWHLDRVKEGGMLVMPKGDEEDE